jgi:hypothetical protein
MIPEVPKAEWDSDYRPAMFRPIGPQIEMTDDADLSIKVSRAQDGGFCILHARSGGGSGVTAGRQPGPDDRSKHVVAIIGAPAMRKGGVGLSAMAARVCPVRVRRRGSGAAGIFAPHPRHLTRFRRHRGTLAQTSVSRLGLHHLGRGHQRCL